MDLRPIRRRAARVSIIGMGADAVCGVILAAGASTRMGRPKALLRCGEGEDTFVSRLVRSLRAGGVTNIVVIGRAGDHALRAELERLQPPAPLAENPAPERGQLSSLLVGLDYAEQSGGRAVLVMPVDSPLVAPATIAATLAAFEGTGAPIARAVHDGRHGHPVVFRHHVFEDLRAADPALGAKAVLRAHEDRVVNVDVPDPFVLRDVDDPRDYKDLFNSQLPISNSQG